MRKIEIIFPKRSVRAVAEMLEEEAPKTCRAVLEVLPHEGMATHAMWCGREVWTALKITDALRAVPPENQTIYPIPGDIMYGYFPDEDVCDFAIFYGRDCQLFGPWGLRPMNRFAKITENLDDFAKACGMLLLEGREKILIREIK